MRIEDDFNIKGEKIQRKELLLRHKETYYPRVDWYNELHCSSSGNEELSVVQFVRNHGRNTVAIDMIGKLNRVDSTICRHKEIVGKRAGCIWLLLIITCWYESPVFKNCIVREVYEIDRIISVVVRGAVYINTLCVCLL